MSVARLSSDAPFTRSVRARPGARVSMAPAGSTGLVYDVVVFLPGGRFEFARGLRDATGAKTAIIIPALDEYLQLADLVALDLETGAIATWLGRVAMLGQQWLSAATFDEPLLVHETPLDWLRAGRGRALHHR